MVKYPKMIKYNLKNILLEDMEWDNDDTDAEIEAYNAKVGKKEKLEPEVINSLGDWYGLQRRLKYWHGRWDKAFREDGYGPHMAKYNKKLDYLDKQNDRYWEEKADRRRVYEDPYGPTMAVRQRQRRALDFMIPPGKPKKLPIDIDK